MYTLCNSITHPWSDEHSQEYVERYMERMKTTQPQIMFEMSCFHFHEDQLVRSTECMVFKFVNIQENRVSFDLSGERRTDCENLFLKFLETKYDLLFQVLSVPYRVINDWSSRKFVYKTDRSFTLIIPIAF